MVGREKQAMIEATVLPTLLADNWDQHWQDFGASCEKGSDGRYRRARHRPAMIKRCWQPDRSR
jgi:hypothetical protein